MGGGPTRTFLPLMVGAGFAVMMTSPIELLYARRFGLDDVGIGLFIFTTMLGMSLVDLFGTRFVPRLDPRTVLAAGLAMFGVSIVMLGVATNFSGLVVGRVVQGFGAALLMGGGLQAAVRIESSREHAIGRFNTAWLFGGALGAPAGGAIAGLAGYRMAFYVCAVACGVVAVALRYGLPSLRRESFCDLDVADVRDIQVTERPRIGLPRFVGGPGLGLALVLGGAGDFVRGGVVYTALPLAGAERQMSTTTIGVAVGVLSAVEIVVLSRSGRALVRWGAVRCILAALAVGVVSSAVVAAVHGWEGFMVGSVLFGIAVAGATVGPPVVILSLAGDAAVGLAQFRISAGVGMALGSTGAALAAGTWGATRLFILIGCVLLAGVVLAHTVGRRQAALSEIEAVSAL